MASIGHATTLELSSDFVAEAMLVTANIFYKFGCGLPPSAFHHRFNASPPKRVVGLRGRGDIQGRRGRIYRHGHLSWAS